MAQCASVTYPLTNLRLSNVLECGSAIRACALGAESMEEGARRIVTLLYEQITASEKGGRAFPLVRIFKTHQFGKLDPSLQQFAAESAREPLTAATPCLTLLASVGDEPTWNSRFRSRAHRAIPLTSESMVSKAPMISRLFADFGVPAAAVVGSRPDLLIDVQHKTFSVFHIEEAAGSPWIPAQAEFVVPYDIKSVLGFGGALAGTSLFAVVLFSRAAISAPVAALFGTLALNVKVAIQTFSDDEVFAQDG